MNGLKSKADRLDADKLKTVPLDLKKLSDVVEKEVIKNVACGDLVRKVNAVHTSKLVNKTDYNTNIKYIEDKIPSATNSATTAALFAVENKIPTLVI